MTRRTFRFADRCVQTVWWDSNQRNGVEVTERTKHSKREEMGKKKKSEISSLILESNLSNTNQPFHTFFTVNAVTARG